MNAAQLIPVITGQIGDEPTQLVDARLLHTFLKVRRDFSTWIKGRIEEYNFESGVDFVVFDSPKLGNQMRHGGDRRSVDYWLCLDMAKELAMVERTSKGREARRYFIACERQLHRLQSIGKVAVKALPVPLSRAERQAINRQAWIEVTGTVYALFHARREELLRLQLGSGTTDEPVSLPQYFRPTWAR